MTAKSKPNELKITRIYDASVTAVWEAWTDPVQTAKWWGPRGFTLTTHSKDLRVGGHWHYTMHGPDGTDYPNRTVYHEVEPLKRLVYDHGASEGKPPLFRVTVTFKQIGNQTEMEMTMAFPSAEVAQQSKKFIKDAGGNSTWDRLAEYLDKDDVFVINRSFEASPEKVFAMWTDPQLFAQWLGPVGTRMEYLNAEIAEGKTAFFKMSYDSGLAMFGKMSYRKIRGPRTLEYTQIFCDEKGQPAKHPHVPVWPAVMLTRVLFTKEDEDQTRVTLNWEPFGDVTQDERKAFIGMKSGMSQGWSEAFDKLDKLLEHG
jgi:uncharacterized protein YndB with AHSA1/START domain